MLQHSSSMDRRGGVRSGGTLRTAAKRALRVGDGVPRARFQVTTSKLRDARADRAYDWGVVCAQCGNGAPNLESDRSTGVRPGVCRTGEKDRARAGVDRGVLGCLAGVLALGDTARARTGVARGELLWRGRVGGVAGVRVPRCVGGVLA